MMKYTREILTGVTILVVILAGAMVWSGNFSGQNADPAAILLPAASAGVHYDRSLQIANSTLPGGQWEVASTSGQLPPGLSVEHFEHGCVPTEPACPQNSFDLSGTPTRAGTYMFSVTFSIGGDLITQVYQVRVQP
ncbi:MAG: hypothetical protein ACYDEZ_07930 [Methanoregula sp.]